MRLRGSTGFRLAVFAIALTLLAAPFCVSLGGPSASPSLRAEIPSSKGDRVQFPPDHLPGLKLADGSSRAVKSLLNVPERMTYGQFVWNEKGVAPGRIWVRIDLNTQMLSVFRDGHEIGTSVILYGADEKQTPTGNFPILARMAHHRSSLYDAEMPYTLRLTSDGVAIHGSDVREGAATHGCIGVPAAFAEHLFANARVGDLVTILR